MSNAKTIHELRDAVERLADAMSGVPSVAHSLRGFAAVLPVTHPSPISCPPPGRPVREVLYQSLDEGAIGPRRFDWLMIAESRVRRAGG